MKRLLTVGGLLLLLGTAVSLSPFIWARFIASNPGLPTADTSIAEMCKLVACDPNAVDQPLDPNVDMPPDCSQTAWVYISRINIGLPITGVEAGFGLVVDRLVSTVPATAGEYCGELIFGSIAWLQTGGPMPSSLVAALKVQQQDTSGNWHTVGQWAAGWPGTGNPIWDQYSVPIADANQYGTCLTGICYYAINGYPYTGGGYTLSFLYKPADYDLYCYSPYGASYGPNGTFGQIYNTCPLGVALTGPPTYG